MNEKTQNPDVMPEYRDVRLTLVQGDSAADEGELRIDLGTIGRHIKKLALLWLCLAVGLGALAAAVCVAYQVTQRSKNVRALVSFSSEVLRTQNADIEISKIRSPTVVEDAMNRMGLIKQSPEKIRNALEISGIMSDNSYEQISLYYDLISDTSNSQLVESLLNTDFGISRYIITLSCKDAELSPQEALEFMNTLLRAYQDYFNETNNRNIAMGSSLSAIQYTDYDYAEAANIFSTTLDRISSYLSGITGSEAGQFRSTQSGYTFADLRQTASLLKGIDLDRITSYIVTHSVSTYDAQTEIDYYSWQIKELTRQRAVQRTRLDALTDSIASYEKDPVIVAIREGSTTVTDTEDLYANYDNMIREKLSVLDTITGYTRSISYYERVVEGFQNATTSTEEDFAYVADALAALNTRINRLIQDTTMSVNEYYEKMAFADKVRVEIPAVSDRAPLSVLTLVKVLAVVEALLILVVLAAACFTGIRETNSRAAEPVSTTKKM